MCIRENVCACVRIPQGVAATLQGTNSEWNWQFVAEKHQRDECTVHEALTHVHIEQQGSLDYRKTEFYTNKILYFAVSLND